MNTNISLNLDFRSRLKVIDHAGVQELSRVSGVPFTTLWKIRTGETVNPGIETVRAFAQHLDANEHQSGQKLTGPAAGLKA